MSLPASVLIAMKPQMAFRYLDIAADRRRAGHLYDARIAVRCSRIFDKPRLP